MVLQTLIWGNFRGILWSHEKWGGAAPDKWRLKLFQNFISNAHLRDLHFQGPDFTWFAMRNGIVYLKERLDRALGNADWCLSQSRTQVFHLPKIGSDHRPILVDTSPAEIRGRPLFRYEQYWNSHEDCAIVIKNS